MPGALGQLGAMLRAGHAPRFVIGGHRGVGENLWREGLPASAGAAAVVPEYRENTIRSFRRAVDLGVDFVEFDVQVTSDGVPVLWHDDTIVQAAAQQQAVSSLEVKDMSLSDFKQLVPAAGGELAAWHLARQFRGARSRRPVPEPVLPWACTLEDALPTLEEVFAALPSRCGFDIELKMTLGNDVARTPQAEVDRIVDTTWDVVQRMAAGQGQAGARAIFFSSFDPDVCEGMRKKQQHYDVWFLSGCGLYPHVDPRRTSIAAALQLAKEQQLAGVVLPAQVLLANESMVAEATAAGLLLMTYGLENDEQASVARQRELGVCGAIVDDVQSMMGKPGACP